MRVFAGLSPASITADRAPIRVGASPARPGLMPRAKSFAISAGAAAGRGHGRNNVPLAKMPEFHGGADRPDIARLICLSRGPFTTLLSRKSRTTELQHVRREW